MNKSILRRAILATGLAAGVAAAQQESVSESESTSQSDSKGYVAIMPFYLSADSDRGLSDDGRGMSIAYGRQWRGGWFWEAQTFADTIESGQWGATDHYQYGASLDLGFRLTEPGPGASPFVIMGVGAVRNNAFLDAEDDTDFIGNVGIGFMTGELGEAGVRIRGEARYVRDDFETGPRNGMNDWRIGLGVMVPIGRRVVEREVVRERVVTETVNVPAEITDSDNDGVPDQSDQCAGTLAGLSTDNRGCAAESAQTLRLEGVNFETNSSQLTERATEILRQVAEALVGEPDLQAEIAGHTDNTGAEEYNQQLSQQRAESVRQFLVEQGVEANRLRARGYGESQPVSDNGTDTGRALNRRVEFRVVN